MDSVDMLFSDSAIVVMHMTSPKQDDYENGDQEWPSGFRLEYFDSKGDPESTFTANYVFYSKKEDLYHATGNVIVQNLVNEDQLNTEELFWDPNEEEFYTEKFVTIKSEDEVHTGEGLRASQDFAEYRILKPSGSFLLEEESDNDTEETIQK